MKSLYQVKPENHYGDKFWIPATEMTKYIKSLLKAKFPNVKFSVRKDSGSIWVSWTLGSIITPEQQAEIAAQPTDIDGYYRKGVRHYEDDAVRNIIGHLKGQGFDGSIDMAFYREHYLLPNGEIVFAGSEGTSGSGGYYSPEEIAMPEGAKKVSLGNSYLTIQPN